MLLPREPSGALRMTNTPEKRQRGRVAPVLAGAAGLAFVWVMWMAGGDFWPQQRPFMPVTLVCATCLSVAMIWVVAAPRGPWRWLSSVAAVVAALATFLGEGLAERGRFEDHRLSLTREAEAVAHGADCRTPCLIESRAPLRVAFLLSGKAEHWSGVCYDATDVVHGVEYGGRVRPPDAFEAPILAEASKLFNGQVR